MTLITAAFGMLTLGLLGASRKKAGSGGGGGTNSLDFSNVNNSQYICIISGV